MVSYTVNDISLQAYTATDLFSPKGLDNGSKLLLEVVSKELKQYNDVLDWGCGWGAMSLWLAKKYPQANIVGLDSDIGAVMTAKQNVSLNSLHNADIIASYGYSALPEDQQYDLVVSNPPTHRGREVVEQMIEQSYSHLRNNGDIRIVVEARLKPWVYKAVQRVFGDADISARSNKHVVVSATKVIQ